MTLKEDAEVSRKTLNLLCQRCYQTDEYNKKGPENIHVRLSYTTGKMCIFKNILTNYETIDFGMQNKGNSFVLSKL